MSMSMHSLLDSPSSVPDRGPDLPRPSRTRWQPLRIGLVELYHYDTEEFWFRDGHLLLRGNNGTGKSKVLSLTLPFLLDASLSSSRVEPDGDRTKRMEWNLLLGRYERRLGYSWVEFGRRDEDGTEHFLTLGCGLHAVAGRARVDPPWYFVTEQRVGPELQLISPERTALSRDRLNLAIEGRGRTFERAQDYRREVDARLFRLGERYDGLIETLIQLRQPQLSKKPDEQSLSNALGNALPELPRAVLEDVADAMNQLEEYRDELARIEHVRGAVSDFGERYRRYARVQARRQARLVRRAQTEFDNDSRALHDSRAELTRATSSVAAESARERELDVQLRRDRAALDELKSDPAMLDARRLEELERGVLQAEREYEEARRRHATAIDRVAEEQRELEQRESEARAATSGCEARASELGRIAAVAGIGLDHERLVPAGIEAGEPVRGALSPVLDRRERQVERVRELAAHRERAARVRDAIETRCHDLRASFEAAEAKARAAAQDLERAAAQFLAAYRTYFEALRVTALEDPEALLAELAGWVESLAVDNPVLQPLSAAREEARGRIAAHFSEVAAVEQRLAADDAALAAEEAALAAGQQLAPAPHPARDVARRVDRPGAPLWQLLEFRDHVEPRERAGIEAALEAAGLLDAWVSPAAVVLKDDDEAWLTPGAACVRSLFDWLVPGEALAVPNERLEALLSSIASGDEDDVRADTWIAPNGQFRIGRLSGAHRKPEARFLGRLAREASRLRRLAELAAARESIAAERARNEAARQAIVERQRALADEVKRQPRDEALLRAHSQLGAAEGGRREAQDVLARVESEREAAVTALDEARRTLERDASDLALPHEPAPLETVARAIADYRGQLETLDYLIGARAQSQRALSRHRERLERASEDVSREAELRLQRQRALHECGARRDEVRATSGAAIAELQRRLHERVERIERGEQDIQAAREAYEAADRQRVRYEEIARSAEQRLEASVERRAQMTERLQGFAATGLLAIAVPEQEIPSREHWTIDPALNLARRVEEQLVRVAAEDSDWERVQREVSEDFTKLGQALSALGQRAELETNDYGMIVRIVYGNRTERPDLLEAQLGLEAAQRRDILSAREHEILENHLQSEVAAHLQRLLHEAEHRVERINRELERRPTTTGVYFRLDWEPLPEGDGGAPVGLAAARTRLLRRVPDAWSAEDRRVLGEFLRARIDAERAADDSSPLLEHLSRALDYRSWHRFRVKRWHDGAFRPLSGPASSGERALGLTVPLFAAASSYYESAESPHAPRLVLLDEAFAGIDDSARSHCMGLIREFDLDFVMTSEREWGCYATLPGVAICHVIRREGVDGIYVSRWNWDGRARQREPDIARPAIATNRRHGTADE